MIIFCKDSRFLADNGKKTALSHTFLEFLAAPRTLRATNKFVLQKEGLVQQLEYVAISRATDTATIISNNVKKEGSPLHLEQSVKSDTTSNNNQHSALKEADVKYSEPPLKNRYVDKPFTTAREVSANLAGYFEGGGANIFRDFPNATEADVNRLENYYMGGKEYGLTDAQVVELGNKILGRV